eukprot:NODE_3490_length_1210_cov_42.465501_g3311_i0.p1 GENE.NODE_3490_length_1210_cov_42.465501_g3311_i0~~NODE_3490_length_1210_cov_42.465501_g3311_i0.p1  ORF type:complete len:290 (+),score=32.45 NODE_3490_length_1210_cov_42.465501_g3311_i0:105-974(+)
MADYLDTPIATKRQVAGVSQLYSSFTNNKKSTMPTAPRPFWNGTQFPLSKYYPLGPTPSSYNAKLPGTKRCAVISPSKRDGIVIGAVNPGGNPWTPGPGHYSSADLDSPFTTYSDASGSSFVSPKRKGGHIPQSPRSLRATLQTAGEVGQVIDGKTVRHGVPGPQQYHPNYESVTSPKLLGSFQPKADRFPKPKLKDVPGPGAYPLAKKIGPAPSTPKLYSRRRGLEQSVADGRNLDSESKAPGPGSYDPKVNSRGKTESFRKMQPANAFVVNVEDLHSRGSTVQSNDS